MRYKAYFPVKPFRRRTNEQDSSRKKTDHSFQDELIKIAGDLAYSIANDRLSVPASRFLQIYLRRKFKVCTGGRAAQVRQLLFATFSFWQRKS